ncbi:MAG TPA: AAA family ATPase [Blastocatellia bacterium]|nr:AAA family ATPase [Blastocatellia bacterium]HMV84049.1 AAA family ATPase [Blastocatellia bacterium]HMY76222.1 AAA family ATPase [Blastocatellia bacterium]HMZ20334.1 AAA family ATPase [Blastocatellia bacterium]HNG33740.1 AAA family ATPase [Blastocatellia bacterium]
MNATVIAFFNNKGGVGKTSLVYHLAWIQADLGARVLAADLDPQANLTAAFLDEDQLMELWPEGDHPATIYGGVQPLIKGIGDIAQPRLQEVDEKLALLAGDLALSGFEDELSAQWPACLDRNERAFRVISAFWRILQNAAGTYKADVVLVDLGPNLGAINRAALISADYIVVPLSPDLFSLQGLRNLGPRLRQWRTEWEERLTKNPEPSLKLPSGRMQPTGYIMMQHAMRLDRPVKAYERWIACIPEIYRNYVLDEPGGQRLSVANDPHRLALLKHYQSLMPLAQESHKPMFQLKPADGAGGAHIQAVRNVYRDFKELATELARRTGIALPQPD